MIMDGQTPAEILKKIRALEIKTQEELGIQAAHYISVRMKQVEISSCLIDHALLIARKMAGIEILVVGVVPQVFTGRGTGIYIPDAFVIGDKVDTLTYPAWVRNIAIEVE